MKKIQVLKPFYRTQEILKEIEECLEIGWTGIGYKTEVFEKKWSEYSGLSNSLFLSSATAGLHLALNALKEIHGWADGDEVITTPLTFVSTNHAILYERLTPVFADIDEDLCIDIESLQSLVTPKTKAVIFVGVGGRVGNLLEISKYCNERGIKLILDAAHMAGTKIGGEHVGKNADISVFSFQAVKNLPTADSGMINCHDEDLAKILRMKSWMGIDKDTFSRSSKEGDYKWAYDVPVLGYKYNGNSIMAAMGIVGLRYLDEDNQKRREILEQYRGSIINPKIQFVGKESVENIYSTHLCQALVQDRDDFISYMAEKQIYCGVHYLANNAFQMYTNFNSTPKAEQVCSRLVTLPCHLNLTTDDVNRIIELANDY